MAVAIRPSVNRMMSITLVVTRMSASCLSSGISTPDSCSLAIAPPIYNSDSNFYARADTPEDIDAALAFALDEHDIETPLFDLLMLGLLEELISDEVLVLYITDASWLRGVKCHQLVISGPHADMQLWIENSEAPVPRRMVVTNKTEIGRPRHEVFMNWSSGVDPSAFNFAPPKGAREIGFVDSD